jgi:hypothetical protein
LKRVVLHQPEQPADAAAQFCSAAPSAPAPPLRAFCTAPRARITRSSVSCSYCMRLQASISFGSSSTPHQQHARCWPRPAYPLFQGHEAVVLPMA